MNRKLITIFSTLLLVCSIFCGCTDKNSVQENGINEDDYNIEYVNSNFDPSVSQTQANNLVNKKASVIIAIATPSAVAAANAAADSDIPVVYCAITDATVMENYSNITGSSDIPNFEKQCNGRKVEAKVIDPPFVNTANVISTMNCVGANTKYPEKCVQFIQKCVQ